jgi:beta-galactosidase
MELLTPTTAITVARYHHPVWGKYAAVVRNNYGKGEVTYVGFMPSDALAEKIVEECVKRADLWGPQQALHFPAIMRSGTLSDGTRFTTCLIIQLLPLRYLMVCPRERTCFPGKLWPKMAPWLCPRGGVAVIEEGAR